MLCKTKVLGLFGCFLVTGSHFVLAGVLPAAVTDQDFRFHKPAMVALGKNLMFDKILSGNMNISCGSCHHVQADTGDGLSLPIGEGGSGLGVSRNTGAGGDAVHERVPRNAPPVWNLGAHDFTVLFHDGRVEVDASQPSGFRSPAGNDLPLTLESVLAAQAMFPVTSATEMAGQKGENRIADAAAAGHLAGPGGVWEQLADRLRAIPEYVDLFVAAFDDIRDATDITYAHAANAIAAFEGSAWRADKSPFDYYLRGEQNAISKKAKNGLKTFNKHCASCHSGKFQTDCKFYAIAMPQIGPGRGSEFDGHDDFGREQVTGNSLDRYKFRTPSLRNIALTAPYGHSGAYNSLRAVVVHHLDAATAIRQYDRSQVILPSRTDLDALDFIVMDDSVRVANIAAYNTLPIVDLTEEAIDELIAFLHTLTDPESIDLRHDLPRRVPSGLLLAD